MGDASPQATIALACAIAIILSIWFVGWSIARQVMKNTPLAADILLQHYNVEKEFEGSLWRNRNDVLLEGLSARKWVGLTVGANPLGLYLTDDDEPPEFLRRFERYQYLFIPWRDMRIRQLQHVIRTDPRFDFEVRFIKEPTAKLWMSREMVQLLAKVAGEAWPSD